MCRVLVRRRRGRAVVVDDDVEIAGLRSCGAEGLVSSDVGREQQRDLGDEQGVVQIADDQGRIGDEVDRGDEVRERRYQKRDGGGREPHVTVDEHPEHAERRAREIAQRSASAAEQRPPAVGPFGPELGNDVGPFGGTLGHGFAGHVENP